MPSRVHLGIAPGGNPAILSGVFSGILQAAVKKNLWKFLQKTFLVVLEIAPEVPKKFL